MDTLKGRVALVTGGAGGIGRGICEVLAQAGALVIVGYHTSGAAAVTLAARLGGGGGHLAMSVPVTDSAALARLASEVASGPGRLDLLVNCHGTTRFVAAGDLEALDDALFDSVMATNVRGSFATVRALRPLLDASGDGLVVNVSSIASRLAIGSNIAYCASKGALDTLTHSLALALAPRIRVCGVAPGLVMTEAAARFDPAFLDAHRARSPLQRLAEPQDIGRAVLAFATHLSASTGVVVAVDGGRLLA